MGLGGNTPGTLDAFHRVRSTLGRLLVEPTFSSLYRTLPQDDFDQEDFWNAVVGGGWTGTAETFLERLLMLEAREGRRRDSFRPKGPRVIDLDFLFSGVEVLNSPRLILPHPGLPLRRFALEPFLELAPDAIDPRSGKRWTSVLEELPGQGVDRTDLTW